MRRNIISSTAIIAAFRFFSIIKTSNRRDRYAGCTIFKLACTHWPVISIFTNQEDPGDRFPPNHAVHRLSASPLKGRCHRPCQSEEPDARGGQWYRSIHHGLGRCRIPDFRPALRACSTIIATICGVEQALSLCLSGQLYRRADALIADAALSRLPGRLSDVGRAPLVHDALAQIWSLGNNSYHCMRALRPTDACREIAHPRHQIVSLTHFDEDTALHYCPVYAKRPVYWNQFKRGDAQG
jgi:hypothetical protein